MEKSERIIRTIIGAEKANTHAIALSVEVMADLLFRQKIPMDDIYVGSDVYPVVAKRSGKSLTAVTRQIERTANLCLDALHSPLAKQYIGRTTSARPTPRMLIIYLAFYVHFDKPFFEVIQEHPSLLF